MVRTAKDERTGKMSSLGWCESFHPVGALFVVGRRACNSRIRQKSSLVGLRFVPVVPSLLTDRFPNLAVKQRHTGRFPPRAARITGVGGIVAGTGALFEVSYDIPALKNRILRKIIASNEGR